MKPLFVSAINLLHELFQSIDNHPPQRRPVVDDSGQQLIATTPPANEPISRCEIVFEARRALDVELNQIERHSFDQLRLSLEYAYDLNDKFKTLMRKKRRLEQEIAAANRLKRLDSVEKLEILRPLQSELFQINTQLDHCQCLREESAQIVAEAELSRKEALFQQDQLGLEKDWWLHSEIEAEILRKRLLTRQGVHRIRYGLEELGRDARGQASKNRAEIAARGRNAHFLLRQAQEEESYDERDEF